MIETMVMQKPDLFDSGQVNLLVPKRDYVLCPGHDFDVPVPPRSGIDLRREPRHESAKGRIHTARWRGTAAKVGRDRLGLRRHVPWSEVLQLQDMET
jgi:hypothetical protein